MCNGSADCLGWSDAHGSVTLFVRRRVGSKKKTKKKGLKKEKPVNWCSRLDRMTELGGACYSKQPDDMLASPLGDTIHIQNQTRLSVGGWLISSQICLQLGSIGLQGRSETMACRSERQEKMDSLLRERPLEIHHEPDPWASCPSVLSGPQVTALAACKPVDLLIRPGPIWPIARHRR